MRDSEINSVQLNIIVFIIYWSAFENCIIYGWNICRKTHFFFIEPGQHSVANFLLCPLFSSEIALVCDFSLTTHRLSEIHFIWTWFRKDKLLSNELISIIFMVSYSLFVCVCVCAESVEIPNISYYLNWQFERNSSNLLAGKKCWTFNGGKNALIAVHRMLSQIFH